MSEWLIETNMLDGETLTVFPEWGLAKVPERFARVLSDEERLAFVDFAGYLDRLSSRCLWPEMREFLNRCEQENDWYLEIATSRYEDAAIFICGYPAINKSERAFRGIQLRTGEDLSHLPVSLSHLYSLIGGTNDIGFGCAGGLHTPSGLWDMTNTVWISEKNTIDPTGAVMFYGTPCGDGLAAKGEHAYWYEHETGRLVEAGELEEMLRSYFAHLLLGKILEYKPKW